MTFVLFLARRWLAIRPQWRRRIVNLIYRFPALDMRLRGLLRPSSQGAGRLAADPAQLSEPVRAVRDRLHVRLPRQ